jgi:hypothetical protein
MSDPVFARFKEQRDRSKQRGIAWKLEYWEWLQIWQDSGHLEDRGRNNGQWVMGRVGDQGAYQAGNVKILRVERNNADAQATRKAYRVARKQQSTTSSATT